MCPSLREAHCPPPAHPRRQGENLVRITLPDRVATMYLQMAGEWHLQPLAGITTAPDGAVRAADGFDRGTRLWCAGLPIIDVPEGPNPR
jgi:hypothetical protein